MIPQRFAEQRALRRVLPAILVLGPVVDSGLTVAVSALLLTGPGKGLLGAALALRSAGMLGALFLGGVLADRLDRRLLIAGTQTLRAVLLATIPWLAQEVGSVLLAAMTLLGICGGLFQPSASTALVLSSAVSDRAAVLARWHSLSLTAQVLSPAAVGLLVSATGQTTPFLSLAGCCAACALLVYGLLPTLRSPRQRRSPLARDARDGLAYVVGSRWMRRVAWVAAVQVVLPVPAWTYLVTVRSDGWFSGAQGYVLAAFAAGGVAAARVAGRRPPQRVMLGSLLAQASVAVGLIALGAGATFTAMLVIALAVGAGVRLGAVWEDVAVAANVPEDRLGRVGALYMTLTNGLMPVGFALVGALQPVAGTAATALLATAFSVTATVIGVVSPQVRAVSANPTRPAAVPEPVG